MGITWTHTHNDPKTGEPVYEYVDDATGKPYDMKAAENFALSVDPQGGGSGYSMNKYMSSEMNAGVGNYRYDKNATPVRVPEDFEKKFEAEQKKRGVKVETDEEKERRKLTEYRTAFQSGKITAPGIPGANRISGDSNRPWAWKNK